MPADQRNNEVASNTVGGQKPQPTPKARLAAAYSLRRYANIAPLVLAAVPPIGSPSLCASEIYKNIGIGSPLTVAAVLRHMLKDGMVTSTLVPTTGTLHKRIYNLAPPADDFEDSPNVYGDTVE